MSGLSDAPEISAIMVAGSKRARAQRTLDALGAQTVIDRMEIVVVDAAAGHGPLTAPSNAKVEIIRPQPGDSFAAARFRGFTHSRAPITAYIEEHCVPAPDWAEALIAAFRAGPWAAVGYAFENQNPETYIGRSSFFTDYANWAHPIQSGPAVLLPGNNVAYRRDDLAALGEALKQALAPDFNIHEALRARGRPLFIAGDARCAHLNFERLDHLLAANFAYCRLLGGNRARTWNVGRRLLYGFGAPLGAPAIKLTRLCGALFPRRALWLPALKAAPIILFTYFWAAVGESLGYLFGAGDSEKVFDRWELEAVRAGLE